MAVIEIKENNATLTKKNDEVVITKDDGDITINNSTNKGKDILSFDENDYSKGSFSTAKSGRDLVLTYTENDENSFTQNITIKNYFSKDGRSTSSSIYGYKLGETETKLTDLYINEINEPSYKKNTINGTMFNDLIIGTDNSDKIYTGKGDDIITAGKGNDTINITGSGKKTINIANGDGNDVITGIAKADKVTLSGGIEKDTLTYSKLGNDLVITRDESEKGDGSLNATTTIKDYFKNSKNADKLDGVTNVSVSGKGKIVGGFTNDTITGSDKNDKIYTGAGNDTIKSGKGNDTIYINGSGEKTFEFDKGQGDNIILGFNKADEVIINFKDGDNGAITPTFIRYGNDLYINAEYDESNEDLDTNIKISGFFKLTEEEQNKLVGWESNTDLDIIGKGTIYGDDKNNVIEGSLKADKIYTGAGDDTIIADRGNDIINITDSGNKEICISDGDGNDTIYGIFNSTKTNISFMKEGEDTSEQNKNLSFSKSNNDLVIVRNADSKGKKTEYTIIKDALNKDFGNISNKLTINGEKIDFSDESLFIHVDIAKQKKNAYGIYEGTDAKDVIHDTNKNTIIAGGKGDDIIQLGKKGHTDVIIGDGDGVDTISGVDFNERNSVSVNFTDATEFDIAQNTNEYKNYDYEINTGNGEGAIIDNIANINDNVELVASSEEDKTFDINGNISITSTSKNTNDTYNINYSSWEDIEIDDEGGNDVINFTDSVAENDLVGFFDVAKSSKYEKKLTSDLIIRL